MSAICRRWFIVALAAILVCGAGSANAGETVLANGVFLVAKPDLLDPNFSETVVLITEPEVGGGPMGVIVNRPLGMRLSEALPGHPEIPARFDHLYGGGPVERNRLLLLVRSAWQPARSLPVLADVYLTGDAELLDGILRGTVRVEAWRAYAGYSGWAPGQLQSEIARGGWYVVPADADVIFNEVPGNVWPELIKRITTRSTQRLPRDAGERAMAAR